MLVVLTLGLDATAQTPAGPSGDEGNPDAQSRLERDLEVFALELSPGVYSTEGDADSILGFSVMARFLTMNFGQVYWVPLEVGGGGFGFDNGKRKSPDDGYFFFGGEVGYPLVFGGRREHLLRLGAGVGVGYVGSPGQNSADGIVLAPTIRYQSRQTDWLTLGANLRVMLPIGPIFQRRYAPLFLLSLDAGLTDPRVEEEKDVDSVDRTTQTEYFRLAILILPYNYTTAPGGDGGDPSNHDWSLGAGVAAMGPTFRWRHFYLTSAELVVFARSSGLMGFFSGLRIGVPVFLGADFRHEIDFGLGVDLGAVLYMDFDYAPSGGGAGLILCPSFGYSYTTDFDVTFGVGFRLIVPTLVVPVGSGKVFAIATSLDIAYW